VYRIRAGSVPYSPRLMAADPTPPGPAPVHESSGQIQVPEVSCFRCCYSLVGLATGGVCPECGLPIADTLRRRSEPTWSEMHTAATLAVLGLIAGALAALSLFSNSFARRESAFVLGLFLACGPVLTCSSYQVAAKALKAKTPTARVGLLRCCAGLAPVAMALVYASIGASSLGSGGWKVAAWCGAACAVLLLGIRNHAFLSVQGRLKRTEPYVAQHWLLATANITMVAFWIASLALIAMSGAAVKSGPDPEELVSIATIAGVGARCVWTISWLSMLVGLARSGG